MSNKWTRLLLVIGLAASALAPLRAAELMAPLGRGPVSIQPLVVQGIPQFNTWLLNLNNAGLNLPAQDLAAISFEANKAIKAAPSGALVVYDAAKARIEILPQGKPGAAAGPYGETAAIPLAALPQLRETLNSAGVQAQTWAQAVQDAKDPQALSATLDAFFDRAKVLDPMARTADVLAAALPARLQPRFDAMSADRQKKALEAWQKSPTKTYVFVNSYSFKDDGTPGLNYYDMRALAQILWAAEKGTNVIFVTALPLDEAMIDHVLRGRKDKAEIRKRIHFVSLDDNGTDFLSQKMLDPKHEGKLREIRGLMDKIGAPTVLYPYMGGPYEWRIAAELGIPDSVYASHPTKFYWGSKSGGRKVARAALERYSGSTKVKVMIADGVEDVYDLQTAARAIGELSERYPRDSNVAVKLNLGSSGEGNIFPKLAPFKTLTPGGREAAVAQTLDAAPVGIPDAEGRTDTFASVMANEGAVIEQFIPGIKGEKVTFPSVQSEILPDGKVRIVSSHEQILINNNNYIGANLSANKAYRRVVEKFALEIAQELSFRGVRGRFGSDFAAIPQADGSYHIYFIENNIRLTGTTHPMLAAEGLTGAKYQKGALRGADGPIRYKSMDHDVRPNLLGMSVDTFLSYFERPENQDVQFDAQKRSGVLFHLVPAVREAGNVGYTIIAETKKAVQAIQDRLTQQLNELEIEYLTGGRRDGLRYHREAADLRDSLDKTMGHTPMVKAFNRFLERHPTHLLKKGGRTGIVFHPHGYTVVASNKKQAADLKAEAKRLMRAFWNESAGGAPLP
jgi:hypothetical protein